MDGFRNVAYLRYTGAPQVCRIHVFRKKPLETRTGRAPRARTRPGPHRTPTRTACTRNVRSPHTQPSQHQTICPPLVGLNTRPDRTINKKYPSSTPCERTHMFNIFEAKVSPQDIACSGPQNSLSALTHCRRPEVLLCTSPAARTARWTRAVTISSCFHAAEGLRREVARGCEKLRRQDYESGGGASSLPAPDASAALLRAVMLACCSR